MKKKNHHLFCTITIWIKFVFYFKLFIQQRYFNWIKRRIIFDINEIVVIVYIRIRTPC